MLYTVVRQKLALARCPEAEASGSGRDVGSRPIAGTSFRTAVGIAANDRPFAVRRLWIFSNGGHYIDGARVPASGSKTTKISASIMARSKPCRSAGTGGVVEATSASSAGSRTSDTATYGLPSAAS